MTLPLEDYALIGDCETAALVGKDGSLDWLCLPRFDSGACFAALLGDRKNGRWIFAPTGKVQSISRLDRYMVMYTSIAEKFDVILVGRWECKIPPWRP